MDQALHQDGRIRQGKHGAISSYLPHGETSCDPLAPLLLNPLFVMKAIELGWDGDMEFAQALLAEAEAGEQEGGAPLRGPLVSAGGAEGGTGRANSKQLCRI